MKGLDEWITGHYGEDQYSDLFCPGCGANADEVGYTEVAGAFATGVYIFKCDKCGAFVQDGYWMNNTEAWEEFGAC